MQMQYNGFLLHGNLPFEEENVSSVGSSQSWASRVNTLHQARAKLNGAEPSSDAEFWSGNSSSREDSWVLSLVLPLIHGIA